MTMLQMRLLGGLQITQNGIPLTNFVSNKAPALLAYLAVTQRAHSRDALAGLLWGELSDTDAKNNLRQTLSNLRKLLDPYLLITRETVGLNPDASYLLDVTQFEQSLTTEDRRQNTDHRLQNAEHRSQTTDSEAAVHHLAVAIELYQGDFLAGFFVRDAPEFEEWMLAQRARLHELALQALHTLTEFHLSHGAYVRAIDYAMRLLALDSWREEAHRQLMLAFARSGQRSAALAQYETCRRSLDKELGVEPSAETTKLYERIRAAGEATRHNLPPQPTPFVGRAQELAQIEAQLLKPECRLLTLLGVGGVGKTRLALATAERLLQIGAFLNGVYFVPLVGVESPELLATAMADACEFTFSGKQDPKAQLANFLRDKETLLVLDNFEQLLDAALWLGQLLKSAPNLKLLVTSRERLNVQWERLVTIEGLAYPKDENGRMKDEGGGAQDDPLKKGLGGGMKAEDDDSIFNLQSFFHQSLRFDAIQLFVSRAQAVQVDFDVNATLPCVVRICQLVEGMPLGLELAAAWAPLHTC